MIINSRFIESSNDMLYNLLKVMLVIDHNIPYNEISEIEVTEETYINTLINV